MHKIGLDFQTAATVRHAKLKSRSFANLYSSTPNNQMKNNISVKKRKMLRRLYSEGFSKTLSIIPGKRKLKHSESGSNLVSDGNDSTRSTECSSKCFNFSE